MINLHALAESPTIAHHDKSSDLAESFFAVLHRKAEMSRPSCLSWALYPSRFNPEHLENL
jgi:hypothetical protein